MSKKITLEFTYAELHALQVALANHFDMDEDIERPYGSIPSQYARAGMRGFDRVEEALRDSERERSKT